MKQQLLLQRSLQLAALQREEDNFYWFGIKRPDLLIKVLFQCQDSILRHLDIHETQWLAVTCKLLWKRLGTRLIGLFCNRQIVSRLMEKLSRLEIRALSCTCNVLKKRLKPWRPSYQGATVLYPTWYRNYFEEVELFCNNYCDLRECRLQSFPYPTRRLLYRPAFPPTGHPRDRIAACQERLLLIDKALDEIATIQQQRVRAFCKKPKRSFPTVRNKLPTNNRPRERQKFKRSHR